MFRSLGEGPRVWNDDEDMISFRWWGIRHETVVEKSNHLSRAAEEGIWLELGFSPLGHLLTQEGPWIDMEGKHHEHLKGMEASERGLGRDPGGYEGR